LFGWNGAASAVVSFTFIHFLSTNAIFPSIYFIEIQVGNYFHIFLLTQNSGGLFLTSNFILFFVCSVVFKYPSYTKYIFLY
jgi:hypothetical protein